MPPPIWPAPMMPTVVILPVILPTPLSSRRGFYVAMQTRREVRLLSTPPVRNISTCAFASQRLLQFGQDGEEVADEAVIGDLEDRGFLVLVDGDDDLGILHAGQMLDRAGDADGDVEFGRDDLAGLADLPVVRRIA